jgi:hypothetical protein
MCGALCLLACWPEKEDEDDDDEGLFVLLVDERLLPATMDQAGNEEEHRGRCLLCV